MSATASASSPFDKSMPNSSAPSAPEVGRTSVRAFRIAVPPMSKPIFLLGRGHPVLVHFAAQFILNRKHDSAVLLGSHLSAPLGDRRQRHGHEQRRRDRKQAGADRALDKHDEIAT